jgi:hypothetical protein
MMPEIKNGSLVRVTEHATVYQVHTLYHDQINALINVPGVEDTLSVVPRESLRPIRPVNVLA